MLDDLQRDFVAEMEAAQRIAVRPARRDIDTLSGSGAARIAAQIKTFWERLGFDVQVEIEPISGVRDGPCYACFGT